MRHIIAVLIIGAVLAIWQCTETIKPQFTDVTESSGYFEAACEPDTGIVTNAPSYSNTLAQVGYIHYQTLPNYTDYRSDTFFIDGVLLNGAYNALASFLLNQGIESEVCDETAINDVLGLNVSGQLDEVSEVVSGIVRIAIQTDTALFGIVVNFQE